MIIPPSSPGTARPPYSPARQIGNLLWTSGVVGYHADRTLDETFEEQVHVTFENLVAVLISAVAALSAGTKK